MVTKRLTKGHVWPEYIRQKSKGRAASFHHVLLCNTCNHSAGGRGDAQAQLIERIMDAEKELTTGHIYE